MQDVFYTSKLAENKWLTPNQTEVEWCLGLGKLWYFNLESCDWLVGLYLLNKRVAEVVYVHSMKAYVKVEV